jgi:hypothetical protein
MTPEQIMSYVSSTFDGLAIKSVWGETSFFYNPGHRFPHGTYFLTIKEKNGDNDRASDLDREGVFRLNFGLPKKEFVKLFGAPPKCPGKGCIIEGPWDFTELDCLMPHPVYGWCGWVGVLNPSAATLKSCEPLIAAAYGKAVAAFRKRVAKANS